MTNIRYANAYTEVLHYLKGINQEDIDKIPVKLIEYFKENMSSEYVCTFDYNKSLKDLDLLDETRGLIGMICLNYWCNTEEEKKMYLSVLNENEIKFQEELRRKYNPNDLFKKKEKVEELEKEEHTELGEVKKENIIHKIFNKIINWIKKLR